ncbi:hypothetical protein B0H17DRAFT_1151395 [Mycena rosella]|uniref:Uncharacterized protein n=1 Tax=Mycena rosella TaxID=1033263 RepID=A0AAD7BLD0_MYCRO|nr:hypothetical protein B0H17DRAFT_1151395 [Mycena rosella]
MDYQAYATAITDELRTWVYGWLAGVHASWALQAALGLPLPHPNHPLPPTFPFGPCPVWRFFEWVHEYGANELRHSYAVSLAFHGRTYGPGSSVAWMILSDMRMEGLSAGDIALAVFEVAGPIYDDPALPFVLGADLVVEALLASLALRRPDVVWGFVFLNHMRAKSEMVIARRTSCISPMARPDSHRRQNIYHANRSHYALNTSLSPPLFDNTITDASRSILTAPRPRSRCSLNSVDGRNPTTVPAADRRPPKEKDIYTACPLRIPATTSTEIAPIESP